PQQARGRYLAEHLPCANCHTIRGTQAAGRLGPDLTHVASRRTLASGTLPNTRGHLGGWVLDPQSVKPGSLMPPTAMSSENLNALLAYLEILR
ncbi:MAG: c-type cytochrome, partial [Thermoanaerobaculia bacterium]